MAIKITEESEFKTSVSSIVKLISVVAIATSAYAGLYFSVANVERTLENQAKFNERVVDRLEKLGDKLDGIRDQMRINQYNEPMSPRGVASQP